MFLDEGLLGETQSNRQIDSAREKELFNKRMIDFVYGIARKISNYRNITRRFVDVDDLAQEGFLELLRAFRSKYDPSRGVPLENFCQKSLVRAIRRAGQRVYSGELTNRDFWDRDIKANNYNIEDAERWDLIKKAICNEGVLSIKEREVMALEVTGLSAKERIEISGLSYSGYYFLRAEAMKKLRSLFDGN